LCPRPKLPPSSRHATAADSLPIGSRRPVTGIARLFTYCYDSVN
jgi:hypothetical protein